MPSRRPRRLRHWGSLSLSRSSPSSRSWPSNRLLCTGSRPIKASPVTVLPQPLSPTSPTHSPGETEKVTSRTTEMRFSGPAKEMPRPRTSSRGLAPGFGRAGGADICSGDVMSSPGHRMPCHCGLVYISAPARPLRHHQMAVCHNGLMGHELTLPRHIVDIHLHDAEIGDYGGKMRADMVGKMAVEIVGCHVDVMRISQRRN